MSWEVRSKFNHMHVMPKDDLRVHAFSLECWCHPFLDVEDASIIIHNSMDRREYVERGEVRAS